MNGHSTLDKLGIDLPQLRSAIKLRWRRTGRGLKRAILCTLITFLHTLLYSSPLGRSLESTLRQQLFALRGNRQISKQVTIVRVDIPAYQKIGVSPGERFPRKIMADAILKIAAAKPKLIILDFVMQAVSDDPEGDNALAAALATTPTIIAEGSEDLVNTDAQGTQQKTEVIKTSIPLFAQAAKGIVTLEAAVSKNGLVEQIALPKRNSLADVRFPLVEPLKQYVDPHISTPGKRDLINYYGKTGALSNLSLAELLGDSQPDVAFFRDRVVFIGMMTDSRLGISHLYDVLEIPIERSSMFGVEIQANIAGNLLDRSWIRRLSPEVEILILSTLAFLLTFCVVSLPTVQSFLALAVAAAAWFGSSYYCFTVLFFFLPGAALFYIVAPVLLSVRPAGLAYQKWRESRLAR